MFQYTKETKFGSARGKKNRIGQNGKSICFLGVVLDLPPFLTRFNVHWLHVHLEGLDSSCKAALKFTLSRLYTSSSCKRKGVN